MCAPPNPVQSVPSKQHLEIVAGPVHARGDRDNMAELRELEIAGGAMSLHVVSRGRERAHVSHASL